MVSRFETNEPFRPDLSEGVEIGVYLALLELIDEGLLIVSDERILEANSAACRWLERSYRELINAPLETLFPSPEAFLHARARWFIQNEMRGSILLALPHRRSRRFRFTVAARIRPGMHAVLLAPDLIGEQYRATALSDTFWVQLAAAIDQPLWVLDEEERLVAINRAAREMAQGRALPLHRPVGEAVVLEWLGGEHPTWARVEGMGSTPYRARVLHGPRPGWRLLLFPSSGRAVRRPSQRGESAPSLQRDEGLSLTAQLSAAPPEAFSLWIAPCVDVARETLVGAEALLRWQPREAGPRAWTEVAPLLSNAAANRAWLAALLTHATRWVSQWRIPLALNLDERQLAHPETLTQIKTAWRAAELPWRYLQLEIDERAFATLSAHHVAQLLELGEMGAGITVDNVGEGACALGLIAHLPVRMLKISSAWVTQIGRDERAERLIDGLLQFGQALGLTVMAFGVATAAQRDFLAALGCRYQQGPIFAPLSESTQPLALKEIASPLARPDK